VEGAVVVMEVYVIVSHMRVLINDDATSKDEVEDNIIVESDDRVVDEVDDTDVVVEVEISNIIALELDRDVIEGVEAVVVLEKEDVSATEVSIVISREEFKRNEDSNIKD
jgi:hypothetical protein